MTLINLIKGIGAVASIVGGGLELAQVIKSKNRLIETAPDHDLDDPEIIDVEPNNNEENMEDKSEE